jgi:hypothetical protein
VETFDPDRHCPKCNGAHTDDKWHKEAPTYSTYPAALALTPDGVRPERITRTCRSCGYPWDEAPLDAPAPVRVCPRCDGPLWAGSFRTAQGITVDGWCGSCWPDVPEKVEPAS